MKVQWLKLHLKGFGRFRESAAVEFVPGVNVVLADNEQGKSTLVAGMAAVIYGLSTAADPKAFSQERFRNWHGPSQFSGELEFAAGGELFRLQRNFDNHRVSLQRLVDGSWLEEVGGEHNPRAQKRNISYEETIARLLGVGNRELFAATFQVTQPLPEGEKIIPGIQQLLSGAGAHYKDALDNLRDELKNITRFTGRRGITPRDMNQDRQLEQVEKEIVLVKREIESSSQLLTDLQETAAALDGLQARYQKQSAELTDKERLMSAWQEWRIFRDRYQQAAATQAMMTSAVEKAERLERAVKEAEATLTSAYGEFKDSPPDTGEALTVLASVNEELGMIVQNLQETAAKISEEELAIAYLEEQLDGEFAAVRGRPGLPHICRELQRRVLERQELQNRMSLAAECLAGLEGRLTLLPPLHRLGKSPVQAVSALREQFRPILAQWQQFAADMKAKALLEEQIRDKYELFRCSSAEELDVLSVYETTKMRLEREIDRLNSARSDALRRVEEVQLAHKTFVREFGELERLGDDAESLLERKLELLSAKKEQEEKLRNLTVTIAPQDWLRRAGLAAIAVFAGAAAWFAGAGLSLSVLSGLASGLLYVLLTGFLSQRRERSRPQTRLGEINVALRQVDALLGKFAAGSEAQLGELRQKLRERQEKRKQLAMMQDALPGEEELRPLKAELEAANNERRKFTELVSGAESVYPDVSAAFNEWRELEREAADLQKRTGDFAAIQSPETPVNMLLDSPPGVLQAPWPEIVVLGELLNADTATVRSVLSWLESLDSVWWEQALSGARSFEQLQEEADVARRELAALTAPDSEGIKRDDLLKQEISALSAQLLPFDAQTDPILLESMLVRAREAEENLSRHHFTIEALHEQSRQQTEKQRLTEAKLRPLQERLSPLLTGGASDALRRWQEYNHLCQRKSAEGKELAGLLSAHQVSSAADLRTKAADSANQALSILGRWEELLTAYPGLPPREQEDPLALDAMFRELESRISRLREENVVLQARVRETELLLAKMQGQAPFNIAGGELKLQELLEEDRLLRMEAAALELAYKELSGAIGLFSATYRQGLADTAGGYFSFFTGNQAREVLLDEQFNVTLREDGRLLTVAQLSQGARDQLYLALRLAVADLLSDDMQLPFIFDDPFLNWDEARLSRMRQTLQALPDERQVVLFSHRQEFASWGTALQLQSEA